MKVAVLIHRTSELDDWEEKVKEVLEEKFQPLEVDFIYSQTCFDLAFEKVDGYDIVVAVLTPKKGMGAVVSPVVDTLLKKGIRVFFSWYEDAPSTLEDFIAYLESLLTQK